MMRSQKITSFAPGLNNRRPPDQLDEKLRDGTQATFLRDAVNCDVSAKGTIRRRPGYTLTASGVVHSVWGDGQAQGVEHGGAHAVGKAAVQGEAEEAAGDDGRAVDQGTDGDHGNAPCRRGQGRATSSGRGAQEGKDLTGLRGFGYVS